MPSDSKSFMGPTAPSIRLPPKNFDHRNIQDAPSLRFRLKATVRSSPPSPKDLSATTFSDVFGSLLRDVRERVTWRLDELRWRSNEGDDELSGDADDVESRLRRQRDRPGSRFYSQPAFAVLCGKGGSDPSGYDGDSGDAMARVVSAFGEEPSRDAELGRPRVGDGSYGRGAAGWTAIVEWTLDAAAQGVVGLIATAPIIAAARRYGALKRCMEERGAQFLINRAGAALVALDDVVREAPSGSQMWLEAAEEMSNAAGRPLSELNYVGADSWLVFLVDIDRNLRYVRIVSPQGEIVGRTKTSINELEKLYLPAPEAT